MPKLYPAFTNKDSARISILRDSACKARRVPLAFFRGFGFITLFILLCLPARPQAIANYVRDAQASIRSGQLVDALKTLNLAIETDASVPELYYMRGYVKFSLDDYIGAEQDFSKSISLFPYLPDVYVNRAQVRSQQQNYNGALEDLSAASKLDSTNADIFFTLARIKLYLKKYYACLSDCNHAIKLKYENETVYIIRGAAELGIDRFDAAVADFKKSIEINPANIYAYIQLGTAWSDKTIYDSAVVYFNKAVSLDSNNIFALFDRSITLIKKKETKAALEDLGKIVRLSPYNSYAYFNRAILYNDMGNRKSAISDFDKVIKLNPRNIVSYYYRGLMKMQENDFKGALDDMDKTIELLPDYADAWYARYEIKLKLKDISGAQKDYKTAMDMARKNNMSADSLITKKKDFLQSLVKLSGDFEEMNTSNSKFQNQAVEITLMPMFSLFQGKAGYNMIELYDTYHKDHYVTGILSLTIHKELISDSLCNKQLEMQTKRINSGAELSDAYLQRAVAFCGLRKYNEAFADLEISGELDSNYSLPYFTRAITRYDLIQLINTLDNYDQQITTIGKSNTKTREQYTTTELEHTYDAVVCDLEAAIRIDPGFFFAYYDRGIVYCKMGNYHRALEDFSKAITLRRNFAEALFNRGLVQIMMGDSQSGCEDLSRAGELGISEAYKVMKRYCYK
ncbi:MAG: tetratricopeptide repeat protein [Bacteroidetes bacterium]|nr:tetratricopeptide repeat protein [Bacteroidota bacterium]